jgi:hypothetical protein
MTEMLAVDVDMSHHTTDTLSQISTVMATVCMSVYCGEYRN